MSRQHDPDPQFVERLGWELESALRRQQTIAVPSGITPERNGRLLLAALILAVFSLALGAAGSYAVLHGQLRAQSAAHVKEAELELEFAQFRRAEYDRLLASMNEHAERTSPEDVFEARTAAAAAEEEARLRELDLEETRLTGRPADDRFTASLIKSRDFVSERLRVRHAMGERNVERLAAFAGRVAALMREGRVSPIDQHRAETRVRQAQQEVSGLDRLLELRRSFLDGSIDAQDVDRLVLLEQAKTDRAVAAVNLELAEELRKRNRQLDGIGRLNANLAVDDEIDTRFWETRQAIAEQKIARLQLNVPPENETP